jgi:hypothetical protein
MQDYLTGAYVHSRMDDTVRSATLAEVPDEWVALGDVNRLRRDQTHRSALRAWTARHFGWETIGEAFHYHALGGI